MTLKEIELAELSLDIILWKQKKLPFWITESTEAK